MAEAGDNPPRTLVRGADGALYLIDKENPPIKLTTAQTEAITGVIQQAETQLSQAMGPIVGSGVNHKPPQVFDDDDDEAD